MTNLVYIALLLVLVLNLWASVVLFRAVELESRQRALQNILVWFAPVIGAVIVLLVRWSSTPANASVRSDTNHEHWQNAQDKAHGVE